MIDSDKPRRRLAEALRPASLFGAGLFCATLGLFFGNKVAAAGQGLFVLALVGFLLGGGRPVLRLPASAWWLAAYVVAAAVSVTANLPRLEEPLESISQLRHFVLVIALLAVPALWGPVLDERWRRDALVLAWLVPMVGALLCSFYAIATGSHPLRDDLDLTALRRASGFLGHVMPFGHILALSFAGLAALVAAPRAWRALTSLPRWTGAAALVLAGTGLYFTFTRGALIAGLAGLLAAAALRSWRLTLGASLGLALLGGGLWAWKSELRYFRLGEENRAQHWQAAALCWVENPVLGIGYRNFEPHSAAMKERWGFEKDLLWRRGHRPERRHLSGHAHNNLLEAFASTGLLGGLALLGFCWCWLLEAWRSGRAVVLVPPFVAFVVGGLTENTFYLSATLHAVLLLYLASQWTIIRALTPPSRPSPSPGSGGR